MNGLVLCEDPSGPFLVPGAEAGVGRLVQELGREQVNLISRVDSDITAALCLAQLELSSLFPIADFDRNRVHWTRTYESNGPRPSQPQILHALVSCPVS